MTNHNPSSRGYSHKNSRDRTYYLHKASVKLRDGSYHVFYYFKSEPDPDKQIELPKGFEVRENPRNGFLTVHRTKGGIACASCGFTTSSAEIMSSHRVIHESLKSKNSAIANGAGVSIIPQPTPSATTKTDITIRKKDIVMRPCQYCETTTAHLGKEGFTCLQCVVDGAYNAGNFKGWSRYEQPAL